MKESLTKDDLILQREQLQEDLLCFFAGLPNSTLDEMCDIICKRFSVLIQAVDKTGISE